MREIVNLVALSGIYGFIGLNVIGLILFVLAGFSVGLDFNKYLYTYHKERWRSLTNEGSVFGHLIAPYKLIPYIFNNFEMEDKYVAFKKGKARKYYKAAMYSFMSAIIVIVLSFSVASVLEF